MKVAAAKVIENNTAGGDQPIGYTNIHFAFSDYTIRDSNSHKSLVLAYPVNFINQSNRNGNSAAMDGGSDSDEGR